MLWAGVRRWIRPAAGSGCAGCADPGRKGPGTTILGRPSDPIVLVRGRAGALPTELAPGAVPALGDNEASGDGANFIVRSVHVARCSLRGTTARERSSYRPTGPSENEARTARWNAHQTKLHP